MLLRKVTWNQNWAGVDLGSGGSSRMAVTYRPGATSDVDDVVGSGRSVGGKGAPSDGAATALGMSVGIGRTPDVGASTGAVGRAGWQ